RLADDSTRTGLEIVRDRPAIAQVEPHDLKADLAIARGVGIQRPHRVRLDVGRHVDLVGLLAPGPLELLVLGIHAKVDILALVVGVEHPDADAIPIGLVLLGGEVEGADHHPLLFRLPVIPGTLTATHHHATHHGSVLAAAHHAGCTHHATTHHAA